jgi:MFS family permease
MTIVWSAGPIVAPFAGGYLEHLFGWRSNFYALAGYSFLLFLAQLIFSGETLQTHLKMNFQPVFKSYRIILSSRDFIAGITLLGISYAMIMLFSLAGAFIIEHTMGYSPVVAGYVSLILGGAWMCGGFAGKALIYKKFLVKNKTAYLLQILLIIAMIASASLGSNILSLVSFAFLIHITAGFIFNNYFTYCLNRFPQFAGVAGGLTGGLAYSLTAILSYGLIAVIKPETQLMVGAGYFIISLFGVVVLWLSRNFYLVE